MQTDNWEFRKGQRFLDRHDERTRSKGIQGLDWALIEIMDNGFWAREKRK